jgi:predicted nucleotidyltransferase component of viral defense system
MIENRALSKKIEQGALLQLILLHSVFSQSHSERIIFQGGTALRWIYGGQRASEDLDFVSSTEMAKIPGLMEGAFRLTRPLAASQFGQGTFEQKPVRGSQAFYRTYAIYRPENQRERIAVRMEIEQLRPGVTLETRRAGLMDCPSIFALMREGTLTLPFSSSIVHVETPEEILSDKLRALFERPYLKGRDFYDLWFLQTLLEARADLVRLHRKLNAYVRPFRPSRNPGFFLAKKTRAILLPFLEGDLRPFLPTPVYRELAASDFKKVFQSLDDVMNLLIREGMEELILSYGKTGNHPNP